MPRKLKIKCPNCGYVGKAKAQRRASLGAGCLLTLLFVLPGLIYFAWKSGYRYFCPRCGVVIQSDG